MQNGQQTHTRFLMMRTLRRLVQCRQMDRIQRVVLHIPWRRTLERWLALVTALLVGTLWLMAQGLLIQLVVEH